MKLKELSISDDDSKILENKNDAGLIKFLLSEQLYFVLSGNNHAVTAIGYEEKNEDFFIILKNSWGNVEENNEFGVPHVNGNVRIKIDDLIKTGYIKISFLLPQNNNIPRSEVLDEKDKEYRTKAKAKLTNCETNEDCKFFGKNGICNLYEKRCYFDSKKGGKKKKTKKRKESKNKRKAKKNSKSQKNFKRKNV